MTRIFGMPTFALSLAMARNFSTIGRTFPGLQYMISRMSNMRVSRIRVGPEKCVRQALRNPSMKVQDPRIEKGHPRPEGVVDLEVARKWVADEMWWWCAVGVDGAVKGNLSAVVAYLEAKSGLGPHGVHNARGTLLHHLEAGPSASSVRGQLESVGEYAARDVVIREEDGRKRVGPHAPQHIGAHDVAGG